MDTQAWRMGLRKFPRQDAGLKDTPSDEDIDICDPKIRACFHIQPWNKTFHPLTIEEWAKQLGWIVFRNKGTQEEAVQIAIEEAKRLEVLIKREVFLILKRFVLQSTKDISK
jgi:hypothetical protein